MLKLNVVSDDSEVVRIQCIGEISQISFDPDASPLESALGPDVYQRKVLLDLERIEFLDSSGISWFVVAHKRFQQQGGSLVFHSIPPRIHQVLMFCRMDRMLRL